MFHFIGCNDRCSKGGHKSIFSEYILEVLSVLFLVVPANLVSENLLRRHI